MSEAIENLASAQQRAMAGRPKVGGFPYLAETLRRAGVTRNLWSLPACQSIFFTYKGQVAVQGSPLISGMADVPPFNRDALIRALRIDQAGQSTFPEFLLATWEAGVVKYDVDLLARTCLISNVPQLAHFLSLWRDSLGFFSLWSEPCDVQPNPVPAWHVHPRIPRQVWH